MTRRFAIAVLALAPLVSGCVSYSSSEPVRVLPAEIAASARIADITIQDSSTFSVPESLRTALSGELRKQLAACAQGSQPLNLQVTVAEMRKSDAGRAILVGDSNVIKGQARFVDPTTGNVVGDYDVSRSVGGGGVLGAIAMSDAEGMMSRAFADELCSKVFPRARSRRGSGS